MLTRGPSGCISTDLIELLVMILLLILLLRRR